MTDHSIEALLRRELLQWFETNPPLDGTRAAHTTDIAIATAQNGRDENQDRAVFARLTSEHPEKCFALAAVLDGIGGLLDGGRCAELAIASILSSLIALRRQKSRITLIEALTIANREVWQQYRGRGGATFAGVFLENNRAKSVNVGDSRVYQYDESHGLVRKSSDDVLGDQFAKIKGLENVTLNPDLAGRLGQYLGMTDQLRPNIRPIDSAVLHSSSSFLLISTDGAHLSGEAFISATMTNQHDAMAIAEALVKKSAQVDQGDNATVICARAKSFDLLKYTIRSPFDLLQLWSVHGVFNLAIVDRPAPAESRSRRFKPRNKNRPRDQRREPQRVPKKEIPPSGKTTQSRPPRDLPKREVIIQQLSFPPEDETSG